MRKTLIGLAAVGSVLAMTTLGAAAAPAARDAGPYASRPVTSVEYGWHRDDDWRRREWERAYWHRRHWEHHDWRGWR